MIPTHLQLILCLFCFFKCSREGEIKNRTSASLVAACVSQRNSWQFIPSSFLKHIKHQQSFCLQVDVLHWYATFSSKQQQKCVCKFAVPPWSLFPLRVMRRLLTSDWKVKIENQSRCSDDVDEIVTLVVVRNTHWVWWSNPTGAEVVRILNPPSGSLCSCFTWSQLKTE